MKAGHPCCRGRGVGLPPPPQCKADPPILLAEASAFFGWDERYQVQACTWYRLEATSPCFRPRRISLWLRRLPRAAPCHPDGWSARGWTLIELLIGLGIFAILATAVYTALFMGISAWRRMDWDANRTQEVRVAFDRLATDLRNSFPSQGISDTLWTPLEGLANRLTFPTLVLIRGPEDHQGSFKLLVVRYEVKDGHLVRWISRDFQKTQEGEEKWEGPEVWVQKVQEVKFQYAFSSGDPKQPYEWREQWEPIVPPAGGTVRKKIPRLVQATLSFGTEEIESVVDVPLGELGLDQGTPVP